MKEKRNALFSYFRKNKNRRVALILTIVALVEILAIMIVSTSAWVESISSIKIFTTIQSDANGTKGIVESVLNQHVKMDEGSSSVYDLSTYFRPSGAFHFAPASSTDGKTMFFPEIGTPNEYRIGSISDKNVNYIAFTIRTKETTPVSLAFDQVPTISFGGTELNQNDETSKLVRFAIGDSSGDFKVYSLYKEKFTEQVPAAETVDPNSTADPKTGYAYTTVYPFKDFVKGKDRACKTTSDGTLSFSMWIQDPTGANGSVYDGKQFTVANLKLIIVKPFTVKAAYKDGSQYQVDTIGKSGTVAIENSEYAKEVTYYAVPGVAIDLHALASEANGYQFMGWSNTLTNDTVFASSSVDPYRYTVASSGTTAYAVVDNVPTLYAKFNDEHDLYLKPEFKHIYEDNGTLKSNISYAAYVFGRDAATGTVVGTWYKMTASSTYYKCTYKGSATSVIFCYMNPSWTTPLAMNGTTDPNWDYRWLQTYDLTVPARPGNYYYVATCRQVLDDITANGTTYDNERNAEITGSGSHDFGTNKLLGYWEHNNVQVNVGYATASDNKTNRIYCALTDTVKNQSTTELSNSNNHYHAWWYQDAASVKLDGTEYQDYDGTTYEPIEQYHFGKKVTLTAEDSYDMNFAGWYTDAAATQLVSTDNEVEITAPDNGNYSGSNTTKNVTYYAKYTEKAAAWSFRYGASGSDWTVLPLYQSSTNDHVFTGTLSLTYGQVINFKIHDDKHATWYANGQTYNDIAANTIINAAALTTDGTDMTLTAAKNGNYNISFNDSTNKLTVTSNATLPTVNLWYNSSDGGTGSNLSLTRSSNNSNVFTNTMTLTEGQIIYFKVHDDSRNLWYSNRNGQVAGYYDGYTISSILENGQLSTSSPLNMYLRAHAGKYKFSFDYSTKKLSIEVNSWTNITITLDSTKVSDWIGTNSAKIYYVSENDTDGLHWELMTASNSNKTYTVSVPSYYANNTQFLRRNSDNNTTWNYWPASEIYRGFNKKFTISSSDGNNHNGTWSN